MFRKLSRLFFALLLLAAFGLLIRSEARLTARTERVWVGGVELTDGGILEIGGGTVRYEPESRELTLTGVSLNGDSFRGAAIYAESDLTVHLIGSSYLRGDVSGCTVLGSMTLYGGGELTLSGRFSGAAVRDCITVYDSSGLTLYGRIPLRWGRLHVSPKDTIRREGRTVTVLAPYTVTLTDGGTDSAGYPLPDPVDRAETLLRIGSSVPVPEPPVREGYRLDGYYADAELTEAFDFLAAREADTVIYIRWMRVLTLTYDVWGGDSLPQERYDWETCPEALPEPTRSGFRFLGWYADDLLTQRWDPEPMTADRTVYAKWEKLADEVLRGADISRYQGEVDWKALKESGIDFAILRIGFRGYGSAGTLNADDNFADNYREAVAAGLDTGVYFFSQATTPSEAREEADYVLELLEARKLALPVMFDYEIATDASGNYLGRLFEADLDGAEYAEVCLAFCRRIEDAGYTAGVYAGMSMLRGGVGDALAAEGYPVWLANWTIQTRYEGLFDYWQYTGNGRAAGIDGAVDLNLRYVTAPGTVTDPVLVRGEDRNHLSWGRVSGAAGYLVQQRSGQTGDWKEAAVLTGAGSTDWTDPRGNAETEYRVWPFLLVRGERLYGRPQEFTE